MFDGLGEKNVETWTAMIAGHVEQEGMGREALSFYWAMRSEGFATPDTVTFVCILPNMCQCSSFAARQQALALGDSCSRL